MASVDDAAVAAQRGDKRKARSVLREIMKQDPRNIDAWILFAEVTEKTDDSIYCLRQVLKLDPGNSAARERLVALGRADLIPVPAPNGPTPAEAEPSPVIASEAARAPSESHPTAELEVAIAAPQLSTRVCPYCAETIQAQAVYCRFCHRDLRGQAPLTVEKHYGVLALVAILLKVIGVLVVLGAIIGALGLYSLTNVITSVVSSSWRWLVPASIGVLGTINGVILYSFGELINLLVDLEATSRLTAGLLQRQNR